MSWIRGPRDFWAGLLFVAIGAGTLLFSLNFSMGTAARMGPGYFPRALGCLMMVLGAASVLRGISRQGVAIGGWRWRPLVITLGSVVIFGLIVPHVGLALSTIFLVFAASTASHEFRPIEAAIASVLMAVLCIAVFVYMLGIQLPVWPAFG
jgi:putative tricarboxylic transport membrane protein